MPIQIKQLASKLPTAAVQCRFQWAFFRHLVIRYSPTTHTTATMQSSHSTRSTLHHDHPFSAGHPPFKLHLGHLALIQAELPGLPGCLRLSGPGLLEADIKGAEGFPCARYLAECHSPACSQQESCPEGTCAVIYQPTWHSQLLPCAGHSPAQSVSPHNTLQLQCCARVNGGRHTRRPPSPFRRFRRRGGPGGRSG